jgi:hypothetical protein
MRLFDDDGSAIMQQEVCLNRKFVADHDVRMLFFAKKMQIFNFVVFFYCKGVSNPQDMFGVCLFVKLVIEFGISSVGIFPLAGAVN